ncbi:MAG: hypothetical protein SF187_26850 [Deltaproteobacteria bacterium]|nr:hypothetical protein [Deltaproteobacteria bacterium]
MATRKCERLSCALAFAGALTFASAAVRAGGYDTPMLYSARHIGMGGTAISYVNDGSALFHNPAGLGNVQRLSLIADFSLLLAKTHASPDVLSKDRDSELTVAPLFLLGAGYRVSRLVTLGFGLYPVASAGATYKYPVGSNTAENKTHLVFLEASPGIAVNLTPQVRLGLGYRVTYVSLERFQGVPGSTIPPGLDFKMTGTNFLGARVGLQWAPLPWLQLGTTYRHRTKTTVTNDQGIALQRTYSDIETSFVLPSKLGAGARADWQAWGFAVDGEYIFGHQNGAYPLTGVPPADPGATPMRAAVPNVFNWRDAFTLRTGVEYRLLPTPSGVRPFALRGGYIFDGKITNERYPSAFGTPPAPTHVFTAGAGYSVGAWQFNVAYAHRRGAGQVRPEDIDPASPGQQPCAFCGAAGNDDYRLRINGFYADVSWAFN